MSVVVTVSNEADLKKIKDFFGAKDENEAIDLAIEKIVREFENGTEKTDKEEEDFDIDIHQLNRISPKKNFKVKANFKLGGRRKPMKYDFTDFQAEDEE